MGKLHALELTLSNSDSPLPWSSEMAIYPSATYKQVSDTSSTCLKTYGTALQKNTELPKSMSCWKTVQHSHHKRSKALVCSWLLREGSQATEAASLQANISAVYQTSIRSDWKRLGKKNKTKKHCTEDLLQSRHLLLMNFKIISILSQFANSKVTIFSMVICCCFGGFFLAIFMSLQTFKTSLKSKRKSILCSNRMPQINVK